MLTMKLSVYGHFVGNSYEKKKQCGIVKSEWMGEIFSDFASDVSRFFKSHGTSYLHKSIIILITILFFSNEPHLNTFATFFHSNNSLPINPLQLLVVKARTWMQMSCLYPCKIDSQHGFILIKWNWEMVNTKC